MKPYSPGELAAIYASYLDERAHSGSPMSAITTIAGIYGKEAGQYCYDKEYGLYYDKQNPAPAQTSKPKSTDGVGLKPGLKPGEWLKNALAADDGEWANISYDEDAGAVVAEWEKEKIKSAKESLAKQDLDSYATKLNAMSKAKYDAEVAKAIHDAKAAAAQKEYDEQIYEALVAPYKAAKEPATGVKAVDPKHIKEEHCYVYSQGTSNKFWNISINGLQTTTHWGRVGTAGTYQTKIHASHVAIDKIIAEKVAKGYIRQTMNFGPKLPPIAPWSNLAPEPEKPTKEIDPDRPKRKFIFSAS